MASAYQRSSCNGCATVGVQVQTKLLTPIAPHWAEHVWSELLKNDSLVITAGWPQQPAQGVNGVLQLQRLAAFAMLLATCRPGTFAAAAWCSPLACGNVWQHGSC
jgi:valyl-tRNA synthetase